MSTPDRDDIPFDSAPEPDAARPARQAGLDAEPGDLDRLIAPPGTPVAEDDGPLVVLAPRPWSPPAAVVPAVLLLVVASGLMAYRAVGVEDWQGLLAESRHRLLARADHPDDAAEDPAESPSVEPPTAWSQPVAPAEDRPEPELAAVVNGDVGELSPDPEPAEAEGVVEDDGADGSMQDDATAPVDPAEKALDEIRKEAERRRAEQEELARLKEKVAAEAPPPRRASPAPDHEQMLAMIEAMKRRHLEAMDHALRELERQQAEWMGRAAREFGAPPPGLGAVDDPVFGPLRRRHDEALERAERDMARLRERMRRVDPLGLEPLAGDFPPPHPFFLPPPPALGRDPGADAGRRVPPGRIVPEGAEVHTFTGPDGSHRIILRWGRPPQGRDR